MFSLDKKSWKNINDKECLTRLSFTTFYTRPLSRRRGFRTAKQIVHRRFLPTVLLPRTGITENRHILRLSQSVENRHHPIPIFIKFPVYYQISCIIPVFPGIPGCWPPCVINIYYTGLFIEYIIT